MNILNKAARDGIVIGSITTVLMNLWVILALAIINLVHCLLGFILSLTVRGIVALGKALWARHKTRRAIRIAIAE